MTLLLKDIDTPAVTIDLDIVETNIARAQHLLDEYGIANRPHMKTHKIPALANKQMQAGAIGIACQKLGEAEVFADARVADDILLTFNVVGPAKAERLAALIKRVRRMAVVLDNEVVANGLAEAAVCHGVEIRFLIECDTGYGRSGVQSPQAALDLARTTMRLPRMRFEGLMTFPTRVPDTRQFFERALQLFGGAGIAVPHLSGGGTPALAGVGEVPIVTEHRAGTYIYNDVMMVNAGVATWANCAMRVRATVVSRPTPTRAILDAGSKVLTSDQHGANGFGHVVEYPNARIARLSEEHGIVELSGSEAVPKVGDVLSIIPNHCCVVTNMMDEIHAVRGGIVEAVWPVAARGRMR